MAVLHLNISLLSSHINELKLLLSSFNLNFDIICITESRITKSNLPTSNIHIPGYNIEQTPTESSAGGTLIYISQKLSYKNRLDLQIYHPKHLESTFIEILLPDKYNFIIGTVYKHPPMKPYSYNTSFSQLLQKIKRENKKTIITGDFNLNLLNYAKNIGTFECLESVNWSVATQNNPNIGFENFMLIINNLLDKHAPFKEQAKRKEKLRFKPWITKGIYFNIY